MKQETSQKSWIGELVANRYEIREKLADGSHSEVYWGRNLTNGPDAAIKVASGDADPFASDHLHREGTVLQMLAGQTACARLLERCFARDGQLVLVLELLDGMSLQAILERGDRRLDLDEVISLFAPVMVALSQLHNRGIIHRDLHPGNIFRSWDPPGLKLLGFGEAKFVTPEDCADERFCGLPQYVAPEVWRGEPGIDRRADIYSMAVILYRCLSGKCPFESESAVELRDAVSRARRPSLVAEVSGLPPSLDDWVTIALCPEREARFDNIDALWTAFLRASGSALPDSAHASAARQSA